MVKRTGRSILAAAAFPGGWTRWKASPRAELPAPRVQTYQLIVDPVAMHKAALKRPIEHIIAELKRQPLEVNQIDRV